MKQLTRWTLISATVLPFVCGLIYRAHDRLQRRQALDGKSIIVYESSDESKGITARLMAKVRIVEEVIAGRLSMLQAAAAFRDLDKRWPRAADPRLIYPKAATEDEVYCLCVIGYVNRETPPDRAAELTRRLHAELDAALRNGTLRLPDLEDASSSGGG